MHPATPGHSAGCRFQVCDTVLVRSGGRFQAFLVNQVKQLKRGAIRLPLGARQLAGREPASGARRAFHPDSDESPARVRQPGRRSPAGETEVLARGQHREPLALEVDPEPGFRLRAAGGSDLHRTRQALRPWSQQPATAYDAICPAALKGGHC